MVRVDKKDAIIVFLFLFLLISPVRADNPSIQRRDLLDAARLIGWAMIYSHSNHMEYGSSVCSTSEPAMFSEASSNIK